MRYVGRHGADRLAGLLLVSAVAPLMVKTATNPTGQPVSVFDDIRAPLRAAAGRRRARVLEALWNPARLVVDDRGNTDPSRVRPA